MNDQNQNPIPDVNAPPYCDWRAKQYADRLARRATRWQSRTGQPYGLIGGIALILLGITLLLEEMGIPFPTNWWALPILIPAIWAYINAWEDYRDTGRLTRARISSLIVGSLLTGLALIFLLSIDIGPFWPVLLILCGLALLSKAWLPE